MRRLVYGRLLSGYFLQKYNTELTEFVSFEYFWDQEPLLHIFYFPTRLAPHRFRWGNGKGEHQEIKNNLSSPLEL